MTEGPIKLTCVCPASGAVEAHDLDHPAGYVVTNMTLPGLAVTRDPIRDIGRALEGDGFSPYVNFSLIAPDGTTLYCGPVNPELARRQQREQALRQQMRVDRGYMNDRASVEDADEQHPS